MKAPSESSSEIATMFKDLNLLPCGSHTTYTTDGAKSLDVITAELNLNHINCIHHFLNEADYKGRSASERTDFKQDCFKLLYTELEHEYTELLASLKTKCKWKGKSGAIKYLDRIHDRRKKFVYLPAMKLRKKHTFAVSVNTPCRALSKD